MSYNKLLLKYLSPYYIFSAFLLTCTGVGAGLLIKSHNSNNISTSKNYSYYDNGFKILLTAVLLYILYFNLVAVPSNVRKRIKNVSVRYLKYIKRQHPEMKQINQIIKDKIALKEISNVIFNSLSDKDIESILSLIKKYDLAESESTATNKILDQELENKIFEILKNNSLLDTDFNKQILTSTITYFKTAQPQGR